ncbi:hypothetical protein AX14_008015 [Amanita brunnescens Koide BX004]|nr:hypothetical protein AX14_008015 [Amanita brunnescens Koide BX004]
MSNRKTIAEEYARLNRDEAAFLAAYPNASKGIASLIQAIQQHNGRWCISHNGNPDERDSRTTIMSGHADSSLPEVSLSPL